MPVQRAQGGPAGAAASSWPFGLAVDERYLAKVERLLAITRLVATALMWVAVRMGSGPTHSPEAAFVLGTYTAYTAGVLALVWWQTPRSTHWGTRVHILDFAWVAAATSLSGGTNSNAFVLFAFILMASAYRWGLARSLVDGVVIIAIACAQALGSHRGLIPGPLEPDVFVMRASYIGVLAVLFGLLSERHHRLSFEAVALGRLMSGVGQASGLRAAIRESLLQLLSLFGARQILIVGRDVTSGAATLWRAEALPDAPPSIVYAELAPAECEALLFPVASGVHTWEARRARDGRLLPGGLALTADNAATAAPQWPPLQLPGGAAWTSLAVTTVDLPGSWQGRLFVLDARRPPRSGGMRLRLLHNLVQHLSPALATHYLQRRLRSRAEARERMRLARELHDGVTQSLAALEVRLELVRQRAEVLDPELSAELAATRDALHEEVIGVRDLMQRVRFVDSNSRSLTQDLGSLVGRFTMSSGIQGRLDWTAGTLTVSPRQTQEVLRIVQEALVNVRRHSGATRAVVRVGADASGWELVVEDDGRGLGFEGRLSHGEVVRRGVGPRVIRERVEALGGTLDLESSAAGTRLEMHFGRGGEERDL